VDISDIPLDVRFRSAPANILFVLDDSGSMDWEFMTPEHNGLFEGHYYVFDDPGDNVYSDYNILDDDERRKWKSQWAGYNKMYYNPQTVYEPWPGKDPAHTQTPRSHPHHVTPTFDLTAEYVQITGVGSEFIVDDGDSGFEIISGNWSAGDAVAAIDAYDKDFMRSVHEVGEKIARWTPNLAPGEYHLYARWVEDPDNMLYAQYHVYTDGMASPTIVMVDQTLGGGTWGDEGTDHYLGSFDFTGTGYVEIVKTHTAPTDRDACADAVKFVSSSTITVSISRAHYYTWHDADENGMLDSGETVYLVNFVDNNADGTLDGRDWYIFADTGDGIVQGTELMSIPEASVPAIVRPNAFADDLQNFANWYSFYRRRELTATAAVAGVIAQAGGMQIGLHSIHNRVIQPVRKILVDGVDDSDVLLDKLYNDYNASGGTALRMGLLNAGRYFDQTDSGNTGGIGASPYAASADGGDCQQAFTILMTDGYYNGNVEPFDPEKDVDGDNGAPYADSYKNTLADVAMYYYERDLAPGLENLVPTNERDDATHQHMVTYGVGFGVHGTLNPADYDFADGIYPTWPDPDGGDQEKIDDLWHAAVNGRGRFLTASDAVDLINDLLMVLKDIEIFSGSASSVSVNGDELYTKMNDDVRLFQSKYYSENWHGDVLAYEVDPDTGAIVEPAIWSAAYQLSNQVADHRKIATYDGSSTGKPFRYDHLTDYQKTLLDGGWPSDDTRARAVLNYLRGDSANEVDNGGSFRNRTWAIVDPSHPHNGSIVASSKLGDIVHSSPVYKNGVLYSGGNDGMLHAIDAETGEEIFAYVPNLVFEDLSALSDPAYTHQYYVDLTPTVANVDLGSLTRLLVGGLGHGGRGYYALNVSNLSPADAMVPANESQVADMVMWEYPNLTTPAAEIADLGYSLSRVTIAKTNDAGTPYVVIFGNGYNSPNGHAVLFILDPATGQLIKRIDPQPGQPPSCNGLSTPIATDVDYDGKVDYVYAGDLNGHLWKFDLTDPDHANWDVAFYDGTTPKPLFKTANQPITAKPNVMYHCDQDGYMVVFGTGRYLGDDDLSDTSLQALYGVWDYGDDADDTEYVGTASGSFLSDTHLSSPPVHLLQQYVNPITVTDYGEFRTTSDLEADWRVTTEEAGSCGENDGFAACDLNGIGEHADPLRHVGWVLNLDEAGERVVSDVLIRDGLIIATSYIPEGSICGTGGSSWVWSLDACSGARLSEAHFDANGDGVIDEQDLINIGTVDDPIWVSPASKKFDGRLQPPAIIILNSQVEVLYMSSSRGRIETLRERSARLGLTFWRVFRP
jgi:type IV pilus assembly protein PilY1